MVNRRRGEIEASFDGRRFTLCLTLGALAELETAFGAESLGALAERLSRADFSARDLVRIIGAALRGGGNAVADEEVAAFPVADVVGNFTRVVVDLLAATFGGQGGPAANP